jgi:hypothetical protein
MSRSKSILRRLGAHGVWTIEPTDVDLNAGQWREARKPPTLAELQAAVGGYVEAVRLRGAGVGWLCETGKIDGKPYNMVATALCLAHGAIDPSDVIVGTLVITIGRATPD